MSAPLAYKTLAFLAVLSILTACAPRLMELAAVKEAVSSFKTASLRYAYSDCRTAYGDPTLMVDGKPRPDPQWQSENLVMVDLPWKAYAAWDDDINIRGLQVHRLAAPSLERALDAIWAQSGQNQQEIDRVGLSAIGGGYNWRENRNGPGLSVHAYGCAVDFDPVRNALGHDEPHLGQPENRYVVEAFNSEGWMWGGHWRNPDGMHFQIARLETED